MFIELEELEEQVLRVLLCLCSQRPTLSWEGTCAVAEGISDTDVVEEEVAGEAVEGVVGAEAEADSSRDPTARLWETADFRENV